MDVTHSQTVQANECGRRTGSTIPLCGPLDAPAGTQTAESKSTNRWAPIWVYTSGMSAKPSDLSRKIDPIKAAALVERLRCQLEFQPIQYHDPLYGDQPPYRWYPSGLLVNAEDVVACGNAGGESQAPKSAGSRRKSRIDALARGNWAESPDFPRYYRDPLSGRLFLRKFAVTIQRSRDTQARIAGVSRGQIQTPASDA